MWCQTSHLTLHQNVNKLISPNALFLLSATNIPYDLLTRVVLPFHMVLYGGLTLEMMGGFFSPQLKLDLLDVLSCMNMQVTFESKLVSRKAQR